MKAGFQHNTGNRSTLFDLYSNYADYPTSAKPMSSYKGIKLVSW